MFNLVNISFKSRNSSSQFAYQVVFGTSPSFQQIKLNLVGNQGGNVAVMW